jgi:phosphate transport system substrate-binding protein
MRRYRFLSVIGISAVLLAAGCSRAPADSFIATQIKARFFSDPLVKTSAISVTVDHGEVTLSGGVSGLEVELQALKLAMLTEGVRKLSDKMTVIRPPEAPKTAAPAPTPQKRESAAASTPPAEPAQEPAPAEKAPVVAGVARVPAPSLPTVQPTVRVIAPVRRVVTVPAEQAPSYAAATTIVGAIMPSRAERERARDQSPVTLLAVGPVPPAELFARWGLRFAEADPHARIVYQANGQAGATDRRQQTADFGVFDMPVSDELLSRALNLRVIRYPAAVWGVVPICNIGGTLQGLNLSGGTLAAVFSGRTVRWDDPSIQTLNPQLTMPQAQITIVHRSDASDETWLFTDYLSAVSPDWKARLGASPSLTWPVGPGAAGNEGVLKLVRETPNSIAYIDVSFALRNRLNWCAVQNRAGAFVKASPNSLTAAAASPETPIPSDFSASIVNAPGADAYPIATLLWLSAPERFSDLNKIVAMRSFLRWMLTRGQTDAASVGYGALPQTLLSRAQGQIGRIQ